MIENPESLIKPLEKYLPVERKPFDRKTFLRQKSQVINHMFVKKKFERSVNNISIRRDKQNSFNYRHKSLKKTKYIIDGKEMSEEEMKKHNDIFTKKIISKPKITTTTKTTTTTTIFT